MHVTYWNTPRHLGGDRWLATYLVDFWRFQLDNQGDCCAGGITESVWLVPGTLTEC